MRLRPSESEDHDQKKRPPMLKTLSSMTKAAAPPAATRPGKRSWIIGEACSRMPMPAVTFSSSTTQSR